MHLKGHARIAARAFIMLLTLPLCGASPPQPRVVNMIPAFWRVYAMNGQRPQARAEAFKRLVVLPHLEAFIATEFRNDLLNDDAITRYLERIKPLVPQMRAVDDQIRTDMPVVLANVQQQLPDFDASEIYGIYFIPSFLHFDGQVHGMGDKVGIFFGIDGLAKFGGTHPNVGVNVAHELFHVYQFEKRTGQKSNGSAQVWQAVWMEGSAAYASQQLAAHATMPEALGNTLAEADDRARKSLACLVDKTWSSSNDGDLNVLIDAAAHPPSLPARGAYLVGYLAAETLSKSMSLAQMGKAENDPGFETTLRATVQQQCANS